MYFVLEGHQATFPERCFLVGTFSERYPWWPSLGIGTQFRLRIARFTRDQSIPDAGCLTFSTQPYEIASQPTPHPPPKTVRIWLSFSWVLFSICMVIPPFPQIALRICPLLPGRSPLSSALFFWSPASCREASEFSAAGLDVNFGRILRRRNTSSDWTPSSGDLRAFPAAVRHPRKRNRLKALRGLLPRPRDRSGCLFSPFPSVSVTDILPVGIAFAIHPRLVNARYGLPDISYNSM